MNICVDVGNTLVKIGIFNENVLLKTLKKVSNENNVKTYYLNTEKLNDIHIYVNLNE